ncbi:interferon regulatory factor [Branchiostoma belcheri]|nr:interferon regulatory factor [Branchiostoma belcheri]
MPSYPIPVPESSSSFSVKLSSTYTIGSGDGSGVFGLGGGGGVLGLGGGEGVIWRGGGGSFCHGEKVERETFSLWQKLPTAANRPSRRHITRVAHRKNNADAQQDCEGGYRLYTIFPSAGGSHKITMDQHRLQQEMANALDAEVSLSPQLRPRSRQKLIPWLRDRVDSGEVPGVSWQDRAKTIVKIRWARKSQHDYDVEQDGAIFKAWAVHSGRYTEGVDAPDPSRWKTNFRCAMNKSTEATYLQDQSQEQGDNPYRVYRLSSPSTDDAYPMLNGHHAPTSLDEECELLIEPHYGNNRLFRTKPSRGCVLHPPNFQNGFHAVAELVALPQYTEGNAVRREQYTRIFSHLDRDMMLTLLALFHWSGPQPDCIALVAGPSTSHYPTPDYITLLAGPYASSRDSGCIDFRVVNNDLYVTRHCRVRVFCRMAGGRVVTLRKAVRTKVFDYARFMRGLEDYATGMSQERPETQVFLNLGQKDPGPPNTQALITVILHHVTAEQRLRMVDPRQNMGMIG